jgi:glycine/D-amino acid oxidase-like deaminating enzyme
METADVVVVGGGAFGASTAYNLARRGAGRVVLLERYEIGSQTSSRAAGLTGKVSGTELGTRLMDEAVERLAGFEAESGRSINFHRSGSLKAALTEAGEARLRQDAERALGLGYQAEMISAGQTQRLAPHFLPGPARAILYCPDDCWLDPHLLAPAYGARAVEAGVELRPNTALLEVLHQGGRVQGVRTSAGEIATPLVVDAAGAWARLVAEVAGLQVPLVPTRHQLYITEPLPGVEPLQPIVRLIEHSVYVRYANGGLMFGGYEDAPRQLDPADQPPDFQIADLPLDFGVLRRLTEEVLAFFPVLRDAPIQEHRGGLPTCTPDGQFIAGPVPNLEGFFIISGCNVGGLSMSPALGRALADLIVDGHCEPDISPYYVERFAESNLEGAALAVACQDAYARKYMK